MAAEIDARVGTLDVRNVATLFGPLSGSYDVSADGKRFLIAAPVGVESDPPLAVVQNWTAWLKNGK